LECSENVDDMIVEVKIVFGCSCRVVGQDSRSTGRIRYDL